MNYLCGVMAESYGKYNSNNKQKDKQLLTLPVVHKNVGLP